MQYLLTYKARQVPWKKGKITGQKPPLKRYEIWAIRVRLQIRGYGPPRPGSAACAAKILVVQGPP